MYNNALPCRSKSYHPICLLNVRFDDRRRSLWIRFFSFVLHLRLLIIPPFPPFTHFLMISHCSLGFVQYPVLILYVIFSLYRWLVFVSCRRKASNRWKLTSIYTTYILLNPRICAAT
ncbi:hypothetical protein BJY00DRAFT_10958 [Aspergillus carlsbadensis]|nr:hypothetical protein BJY00DRAFT_10958 [Aspergillus carlsbadensis]